MMTLANRPKKRCMTNLKFVKLVADKDLLPAVTIKPGTMSRLDFSRRVKHKYYGEI